MACTPTTGMVYMPAQPAPFAYADAKNFKYRQGAWNTGVDLLASTGPQTPAQQAALATGPSRAVRSCRSCLAAFVLRA